MARRNGTLITKRTVDAAKPSGKRYVIWDSELSGFGMRVETSGAKCFFVRYRAEGGGRSAAQRLVTIGRYGVLTPDEARKQAKTLLGGVAKGEDPGQERREKRLEMKIDALVDLYELEGCVIQRGKRQGQPMKPATKKNTINRLRNHVVPLLGHKRATEVNAGDIERFVRDVTAGKTNRDEKVGPRKRIIVRGGEGAARKVARDLSAVFSFAIRREIVARNPCETAAIRKTDNQNERYLNLDEITRLGNALDELEQDGVNPKAVGIARLWALTGCRHKEIAGLRWSEVNLEEGLLEFSDSKSGKSVRPLGAAAQLLIKKLPRKAGSPFLFPAERGEGYYQGTKRIWAKAMKKAQLVGVTPHTLRHTIGSTAISTGEPLALTGAILGHSNPRSTAIYAHVQNDPSRRAANRVSKKIAAALKGTVDRGKPRQRKSSTRKSANLDDILVILADRLTKEGLDPTRIEALVADVATSK